ncbi:MAG: hypothetical protein SPD11_09960, partial [Sphaerochaetaceae bacterium]|nr:hypothetical protein [Sphaerochaetaceae bacterium]
KKVLIGLLSVLVLVSCTEPNSEVSKLTIPVPVFGEVVSSSSPDRGIVNMPIEKFGNDVGLATAVMTTMPAMTSILPIDVDVNMNGFGIDLIYSVYGFEIKLQIGSSAINKDGVYLRYNIYSPTGSDKVVGVADYYYSIVEKKFSYRQIVVVTLDEIMTGPQDHLNVNQIFVLEYNDIELQNFAFSAGQLTANGYLDDNAIVDAIRLGDSTNKDAGYITFLRKNITMRAEDGIVAVFSQPDSERISTKTLWTDMPQNIQNSMKDVAGENYIIDTGEERSAANKDFALKLVKNIYTQGERIATRNQRNTPYRSYAEYQSDSIKNLNSELGTFSDLSKPSRPFNSPMPSIYRVTDGKGASTHSMKTKPPFSINFLSVNSWEKYNLLGFGEFYSVGDENLTDDDIGMFLAEQHLRACGITDSKYVDAFKKAVLYAETHGFSYPNRIQIDGE